MRLLSPLAPALSAAALPTVATVAAVAAVFAFGPAGPARASDASAPVHHALAMHGEPKYPAGFEHFDYVNPDAPKGGTLRLAQFGTFDSFNAFIPKGQAGISSSIETLLTSSADEPFTEYGLIAQSIEMPDDRSWVVFNLRKEARWHDGKPITAHDVVWSYETLTTRGQPFYRYYYGSVDKAVAESEHRVRFTFTEQGNRELPLIIGQLPILPRHYWESRDFEATTLEPPLGSGPYRVSDFEPGRFIVLERVEDYWGRDLPVNRGSDNFDRIRNDYYRDFTVIREALKAGEIDYWRENTAKSWAVEYDVPAVRKGWLKKEAVAHQRPAGMQAFVMNTRREVFADPRLRQALAYAFDFEWTNRTLFFGQYTRTNSYFANSELASTGLPEGEELAVLEPYRDRLPAAVFEETYAPPRTDASGSSRRNLREAFRLLAAAGYSVKDGALRHDGTGKAVEFEILLVQKAFERVVLPFTRNLKRLGIEASIRLVDSSQYVNRIRAFDFDMVVGGWGQSESPGNEQRDFWSSGAADSPAARNTAGVRDPVVDELIELLIKAPSRESLIARTRALDRVLLHGHYVIPNWHLSADRLLYWDKFSRPERVPRRGTSTSYWWYDESKAARLARERGS